MTSENSGCSAPVAEQMPLRMNGNANTLLSFLQVLLTSLLLNGISQVGQQIKQVHPVQHNMRSRKSVKERHTKTGNERTNKGMEMKTAGGQTVGMPSSHLSSPTALLV